MRKKTMAPQLFWVLISCVSLLCSFSEVSAQEIVNDASLVARPTSGGGDSFNPIVTPDGRYVLFASTAANLVVSSNNTPLISHGPPNTLNVFLRDRSAGKTSLVSVNLEGNAGANADTIPVGISTNGRYVLFESAASNLVFGDTNTCTDVFLRDVIKGETILVSASYKGGVAFGWSRETVMTPDGRWVAFASSAVDIVSGDTNEIVDVFVRDLQTKVTKAASTGAVRKLSYPQGSSSPVITPDGRYVAFLSGATNLVPRVTTSGEVYVRDLVSGATRVVSTNAHTSPSDSIISYNQAISDDGQYVAFETSSGTIFRYHLPSRSFERVATNATVLNPASTSYGHFRSLDMSPDGRFITWLANSGTGSKVLLWDGQTKVTTLVNVDINHLEPTNSLSEWPCVSADGRWVAFLSTATNLTTNVVVEGFHLYVRDMQAEDTRLVDRGTNGIGSPREFLNAPCLAPDGKFIVYDCSDSGQVDGDNNHAYDVFFTDLESGTTELISARDAALPSTTLPAARYGAVFSLNRDGRFVAFTSFADNLLRGATNTMSRVFVRDRLLGTNLLVSADTNGLDAANGMSTDPSISGDGRFVVFSSIATNLVLGDMNKNRDVFLRDLQKGITSLISVNFRNTGPGNGASFSPAISEGGESVLFRSRATDLVQGSSTSTYDNLLWRNLLVGETYTVAAGCTCAAMTPNGRFVAYGGIGRNMYIWDSQSRSLIYTNNTVAISQIAISPDGNRIVGICNGAFIVADRSARTNFVLVATDLWASTYKVVMQFSADSRYLTFNTPVALDPEDKNLTSDVYLFDFQTGQRTLLSRGLGSSASAKGASDSPVISADSRFIAYRSFATNIVTASTAGNPNIFLYDRQTGTNILLSVDTSGLASGNYPSSSPAFSADGRTLVFFSLASDLVENDFNQANDLFAIKVSTSNPTLVFRGEIVMSPDASHSPTLSWPVDPTRNYRVEFKDNLSDPQWQTASGEVKVDGGRASFTDSSPALGKRFYRIVAD